jgi:hypothetical protein
MKNIKKAALLFTGLCLLAGGPFLSADEKAKAELPILTTSAGQSPDANTLNIILEEAGILFDYCDVPDVELFKAGVGLADKQSAEGFHIEVHTDLEKFSKGTPYKTIIFAIGASLKGMGASGLTVEKEVKRLESIIEHCKQKNVYIIGLHVGGVSKRGAPGSDNERMIDAVAPHADLLLVTQDSNKDGRFTDIAKETGAILKEVEYALELVDMFLEIFE